MSLQAQLDIVREQELIKTPPAVLEIMRQALTHIREAGMGRGALGVGDTAALFALANVDGSTTSLREQLDRGPVILDFFRGGWCPFCSLELRAYQSLLESIENAGATLLAISPETPNFLKETVEQNDLAFPLLSDQDNRVANDYGLVFTVPESLRAIYDGFGLNLPERHGSVSFELPIPATYLVDQDGTIRRAFHDLDASKRAEPEDFIEGLRELKARA